MQITLEMPEELKAFNWGAFWLTFIWGSAYNIRITYLVLLSSLIPFVGILLTLGLSIYFGTKGNEWAWKSNKFSSIQSFKQSQKMWAISGWIFALLGISLLIGCLIFLNSLLKANNFNIDDLKNLEQILGQQY